jgi:hypothetical protein
VQDRAVGIDLDQFVRRLMMADHCTEEGPHAIDRRIAAIKGSPQGRWIIPAHADLGIAKVGNAIPLPRINRPK